MNYLIASHHEWNMQNYIKLKNKTISDHSLFFIDSNSELSLDHLSSINPRYIFFPHWSHIVSNEILDKYDCVCFHMTDLPFGRGGSPLQNLILNNFSHTKITALKMSDELDAGPIYLKKDLALDGSAEDIYKRSSKIIFSMIDNMINNEIIPSEQTGKVTHFKRRKPYESEIKDMSSLNDYFNFIRMLDATGYPKAFLEFEGFNYEFSKAKLANDELEASVKIKKLK